MVNDRLEWAQAEEIGLGSEAWAALSLFDWAISVVPIDGPRTLGSSCRKNNGNAKQKMTEKQLKYSFAYTKFHIGMYTTSIGAVIAFLKFNPKLVAGGEQ